MFRDLHYAATRAIDALRTNNGLALIVLATAMFAVAVAAMLI